MHAPSTTLKEHIGKTFHDEDLMTKGKKKVMLEDLFK